MLQTVLSNLAYLPPTIAPTTYFGTQTEHALLLFQSDHQLNKSGFLDIQTQSLMNKVLAANPRLAGGSYGNSGTTYVPPVTTPPQTSTSTAPLFTKNLFPGLTDSQVTSLQTLLTKDQDYAGPVTGYYGALTEAGVQAFQAKHGIVSSGSPGTTGYGSVGPKTRVILNQAASQYGMAGEATETNTGGATGSLARNLSLGSQGSDVTLLQQLLTKDQDYAGPVTGYYGALTEAGVQAFQAKHGIVSSGSPGTTGYGAVGPKTREGLGAIQ